MRRCARTQVNTGERVKLVAVKHDLQNPMLPTLRAMELDDVLGKLPYEHSRTSVPLPPGTEELPMKPCVSYEPPQYYVKGFDVLPLYHMDWHHDSYVKELSFLDNPDIAGRWEDFKKNLPLSEHRIVHLPKPRDCHFMNYYPRYLHPDVTSSWRKHMKAGPIMDDKGQLPIPADQWDTYRG